MLSWKKRSLTKQNLKCPPVVIQLLVDYTQLLQRLTGRRSCPTCGRLYNIYSQPPRVNESCDVDGSKLVIREDDREEVISGRLAAYDIANAAGSGLLPDAASAGSHQCRSTGGGGSYAADLRRDKKVIVQAVASRRGVRIIL